MPKRPKWDMHLLARAIGACPESPGSLCPGDWDLILGIGGLQGPDHGRQTRLLLAGIRRQAQPGKGRPSNFGKRGLGQFRDFRIVFGVGSSRAFQPDNLHTGIAAIEQFLHVATAGRGGTEACRGKRLNIGRNG